jgi:hypothetical protein
VVDYSIKYWSVRAYLTKKRRLDARINERLGLVRSEFGKQFDLYDVLQDSMGLIATVGNRPISYKEFVLMLLDRNNVDWLFNIIDKYAETFKITGTGLQDRLRKLHESLNELMIALKF